jgi:Rps23 Pro-64 3,4-dihydroxylase Tpa1-like proline 4-hydroxylase
MSCLQTVEQVDRLFPYSRWSSQLPVLAKRYRGGNPVPHILLADFLEVEVARAIAEEFPNAHTEAWTQYKHHNENKLGMAKRELFPPGLGEVTDKLNSPAFVSWLSSLTGIPDLVPDRSLEGGGLHQSSRGGFLNVHTDFSHHHYHKHWRRRVNLILYLNPTWRAEWGGAIELWDVGMRRCVAKYPPLLNHALIFNTNEKSLHGFPEPLSCPQGVSRRSVALYYYTVEKDAKSSPRSTNYHARPGDGIGQAAMIWLDKQAVNLYSRAKARFRFSDDLASKILGLISKKK